MPEKEFAAELQRYDTSGKGTLRFDPAHPIPATLVRKIIRSRMASLAKRGTRFE